MTNDVQSLYLEDIAVGQTFESAPHVLTVEEIKDFAGRYDPQFFHLDDEAAREAKKLAQRGVKVSIGAHGQQAGVGSHWELWSFVRGGMTPVESLRAGTIESARSLGMDRDIGSLEAGKLADLIVLDADPSENIRNSDKIDRVMLGGRLYDARTMNEVETGSARRLPYWWE